jgi:hypothetical protein
MGEWLTKTQVERDDAVMESAHAREGCGEAKRANRDC